jgi:glucose-6-phosphate 1-dehydrogenase
MSTKLIIFGITGDLSTRKLLPALAQIINTGKFDDMSVIGVSRRDIDIPELLQNSLGANNLESRVQGFTMDMSSSEDYARLKDFVALGDSDQAIIYLSVPPSATSQIIELLGQSGLNSSNVKLLLEKPFGVNLTSAHDMIDHVAKYFEESQVYRIDHYLAKEMSQNIVAFRSGNALFDHIWDNGLIERIEVAAIEKIGIEGRAEFYEQTGALRDIVQGHLMQLLSLTLMDTPDAMEWDDVPALRFDALRDVSSADPNLSLRGQYETYKDEVGNQNSIVETFVSLELRSTNPKWQNVPLILTTGKALNEKSTEVRVFFRKNRDAQTNCLIFKIQPHEGVEIELAIKKPGYDREFETKKLSFEYPEDVSLPDAYEQVIVDATLSRKSLFASSAEVIRAWEILQPVQDAWLESGDNLRRYESGSTPESIVS